MSKKVFKSLDEQIEILKSKGLIIEDETAAKEILFRENYFFISGYRHLFMRSYKEREFIKGTTFEELYSVFLFDRKIRNIMFQYILVIENNIKSIISYQLSKKYGIKEKDYLNPKNFTEDNIKQRQVRDILNKMKRQIRVNGRQHTATMHYIDNYGYIPLWILVKVLSFGILSEFYNILKSEDAMAIADIYHLSIEELSTYLTILANFRNLCAHEDILYDHRTQKEIPDTKYHRFLDIEMTDDHYNYGKNDLFAVIIIMKQMLKEEEFNDFLFQIGYEIDILEGSIQSVSTSLILNKIGFPDNWRDINELD
jgi:abortive infection bacteriophage resistance protein